MIFTCINNDQALAPDVRENHTPHPRYVDNSITVGRNYPIYATAIFFDDLTYLIQNDFGDARWEAPYFFQELDGRLPPYWEFRAFSDDGLTGPVRRRFQAIWGYPELVRHPAHNDGLQDNRGEDVDLFAQEVLRRAALKL